MPIVPHLEEFNGEVSLHRERRFMYNERSMKSARLMVIFAVPIFLAIGMQFCAFSAEDIETGTITVTVPSAFALDYTGSSSIVFILDEYDLGEGSLGMPNQGDLIWWANTAPWEVRLNRTEWDGPEGGIDDLILQAKYGPPPPPPGGETDDFTTVPVAPDYMVFYNSAHALSYEGHNTGEGLVEGIDWKVKGFDWSTPPGTYTCVVTFEIMAS